MTELTTDAYAFLNISDPVCAWATYRGVLVSPPSEPGFVSVWSAGLLRSNKAKNLARELALESARAANHREKVSRLTGMFCFLDLASAERACSWATSRFSHFRPEYLAELNLREACTGRDRFDANWITFGDDSLGWVDRYWSGESVEGKEPIWETLVNGRMIVLGTELRDRAYKRIKQQFPDTLCFLEIARQAAWVGSDVGNISAQLVEDGDDIVLHYIMDMREAEERDFLRRLQEYRNAGLPINHADMAPHLSKGSFGAVPDLVPYGFRRPKSQIVKGN